MKKIVRLTIENFQSHRFTQVEFVPGFNVIVGASDQGKSAIIRALKWLLFNEPRGADFIRVGATACQVTLVLADGTLVTRERTTSRNRYYLTLPGQEEVVFEGFGSRVPKEIQVALGVGKVTLDDNLETILNLGEQLAPPFLLAETGSVKAKALGRLYGVHIVDGALRETIRDLGRNQQERRRLETRLGELAASLSAYDDLPELALQLERIRTKLDQCSGVGQRLEHCATLQGDLADLEKMVAQARGLLQELAGIDGAANLVIKVAQGLDRLAALETLERELKEAEGGLARAASVLAATTTVEQGTALLARLTQGSEQVVAYGEVLQELQRADRGLAAARKVLDRTGTLPQAEQCLKGAADHLTRRVLAVNLRRDYCQTEETLAQIAGIMSHTTGLPQVRACLADFRDQAQRVCQLGDLAREYNTVQEILVKVQNNWQEAQAFLRERLEHYSRLLEGLGKCPLCFNDIDPTITKRILSQYNEEVQANGL